MSKDIQIPTAELVQEYINKFDSNKDLVVVEDVLSELFGKYSQNCSLRDVLIKVSVLNSLYSTQIYAVVETAKHIVEVNIDNDLRMGMIEVVEKIARVEVGGKIRTNYSFASKYCHWHQPEMYPIYDSYVDQLLWAYHVQRQFEVFKQADLRNYPRYKEIVESFRKCYNLTQFRLKDLDKFLWGYGRKYAQ
ncbi:hypothetical protein ANAEL_00245 [Anaerolineales bacterium]|nr:hypothetical protein ANAEL_00245 [Anaerolineales bacterium]